MRHHCLTDIHGARSNAWTLVHGATGATQSVRVRWALKINHGSALQTAAVCGAGIILQPDYVVEQELRSGALVRVLPRCSPAPVPVHLMFTPQRPPAPKLRAWINFIVERFGTSLLAQPARRTTANR